VTAYPKRKGYHSALILCQTGAPRWTHIKLAWLPPPVLWWANWNECEDSLRGWPSAKRRLAELGAGRTDLAEWKQVESVMNMSRSHWLHRPPAGHNGSAIGCRHYICSPADDISNSDCSGAASPDSECGQTPLGHSKVNPAVSAENSAQPKRNNCRQAIMSTHPSSPIASSSRLLEATRPAFDRIRSSYVDRRPTASSNSISVDDNSTSSLSSVDREWQENIRQLHLLIDVILLPFFGKWLGRKTAAWLYARYTQRFANTAVHSIGILQRITARKWWETQSAYQILKLNVSFSYSTNV
jgi:hypothetical protein